jgi:hypothetical protein
MKITLSQIFGILSLIATLATVAAGVLDSVNPKYALVAAAIGAGINAFTTKVQGVKPTE